MLVRGGDMYNWSLRDRRNCSRLRWPCCIARLGRSCMALLEPRGYKLQFIDYRPE